jgi:predicted DCC family thiol-disulfide oxidoreductase YuxK
MTYPYRKEKIVFFDGYCILCNRSVNFLLKYDRKKRLKFASLQSEHAAILRQHLQNQPIKEDTIIFSDEGRIFIKSTAVLKIGAYLGLPWSISIVFMIIPRPLRDMVYDVIARNRARWFGMTEQCRIPDNETRGRILD